MMKLPQERLIDDIKNSSVYRTLTDGRTDVELWQDNHAVDGWDLFRIVTLRGDTATILADLRAKEGHIERRVVDAQGRESWVEMT